MTKHLKAEADEDRILSPGDRLFEPIYNFLIILASISNAASLMVGGDTHTHTNPVMRVSTRWPDLGLALPLGGVLQHVLNDVTPKEIHIGIITRPGLLAIPMPNIKFQTSGYETVLAHVIAPIFLSFFERYNVWLTANRGDAKKWHPTLNFARVIRNAAAHGKIEIRNPASAPAVWRDLSYGYAQNGARIIGTDLKFGEIIALMFEADEALDSDNVPIL
jgi:hypothetical protein